MREAAVLSSPSDARETPHARTLTWFRLEDAAFHAVTKAAAVAVLLVLGSVIVALVYGAWPAFRAFGWDFLISARWNPVTEKFGALAPIYGTVVTSLLAMLIAVPVGLGVAIFLTELCPPRLRRPVGIAIELLAGTALEQGLEAFKETPGSVPGDAAATPETAAPKQKPKQKPKRKGPPSSVTVINATANTATGIVITAGDKTTKLSKPLAPKGRATVRLPKLKGCTVSVAATFEGGGKSDAETFDVCKEKSIRFTD